MILPNQPQNIQVPFSETQMRSEFIAITGWAARKIDGHEVGCISYADFQLLLARAVQAERNASVNKG